MRKRSLVLGAVLAVTMAGCTAANKSAVRIAADGTPVAVNCGTWIEGINVRDQATDEIVWVAHARPLKNGGLATVATIRLGQLPHRSWVEGVPFRPLSSAARLRFEVVASGDDAVIELPEAPEAGRVYRPGKKDESASRFDGQTCSGIPISPLVWRISLVAVAVAVFAAVGRQVVRRRRVDSA